jgi:fumarylpyruvate hydrolase
VTGRRRSDAFSKPGSNHLAYLFDPPEVPSVPIRSRGERFPVRRIYCVGRNYAAHAREMGFDPDREPPFFFTKPADAIVGGVATIPYPPDTDNFHYEVELVAALATGGRDIPAEQALGHVFGYAVGNDLTRRDRQMEMREKGRPWDIGKAFDRSAQIGEIVPIEQCGDIDKARIWLSVNGAIRQDSTIAHLIWSVAETISTLSHSFELKPGDLIYTGTPEGVGPIVPGDEVAAGVDGLGEIRLAISGRAE